MVGIGAAILRDLQTVEGLRAERARDAALAAAVQQLKRYQQQRFTASYADLLASPRYGEAAQFFLDDLYGPRDFAQRDAQFARIVPSLVRLFPADVVNTVATLGRLHALSEGLDSAMARVLATPAAGTAEVGVDAARYVQAWQAVGQAGERDRQVALTIEVGHALEAYVRHPVLRGTLRMMRGPARLAGLASLQAFLEGGFDAFAGMGGAEEFLATIASRERALAQALFSAEAIAWATSPPGTVARPARLGQLP